MICPTCNKNFECRAVNQIYCSRKCERNATHERYANRDEPTAPTGKRPIDEFTCKNCGKTVFIYDRSDQRSSYCCGKCAVKFRNRQAALRNVKKRGDNIGLSGGMTLGSLIRRERRDLD